MPSDLKYSLFCGVDIIKSLKILVKIVSIHKYFVTVRYFDFDISQSLWELENKEIIYEVLLLLEN